MIYSKALQLLERLINYKHTDVPHSESHESKPEQVVNSTPETSNTSTIDAKNSSQGFP